MNPNDIELFQKNLLAWYDRSARILPWRDNPSPYRVWISEIMLQQTRVETAIPYFERFLEAVPAIDALADISDHQLLKLWEGLGYYSRAKNLKKAAQMIVKDFGGHFPPELEHILSLPGIGPYTAGAISSIAFGARVPAVDGNVLRVISRITANKGDITNDAVKKEIEELVINLLPWERLGDFNQALMELGATVCLPNGSPKCEICPVSSICKGHLLGIAEEFPVKARKKERRTEKKTVFIIEYEGNIAIRQRGEEGLLSGLWEFPNTEGHLTLGEAEKQMKEWGVESFDINPLKASKHIFTHLEWHMIGYFTKVKGKNHAFLWASRDEIKKKYSIPAAFKAYTKTVEA